VSARSVIACSPFPGYRCRGLQTRSGVSTFNSTSTGASENARIDSASVVATSYYGVSGVKISVVVGVKICSGFHHQLFSAFGQSPASALCIRLSPRHRRSQAWLRLVACCLPYLQAPIRSGSGRILSAPDRATRRSIRTSPGTHHRKPPGFYIGG
jgi:hypothetical protein